MEVFPSIEDLRHWADRLEEVQERLASYFERAAAHYRRAGTPGVAGGEDQQVVETRDIGML